MGGTLRQIAFCIGCPKRRHGAAADTILYFAYGANMAQSVLVKRGVKPFAACPAKLPLHQSIAFRHRGGYATIIDSSLAGGTPKPWQRVQHTPPSTERGEAQLLEEEHPTGSPFEYQGAHGVLYVLHRADMHRLASRETGYTSGSIEVTLYSGEKVKASVFASQSLLLLPASVPPQRRYLKLLLEGAETHGLARDYIEWLRGPRCPQPGGLGPEYFDTPSELLAQSFAIGIAACAALYATMH